MRKPYSIYRVPSVCLILCYMYMLYFLHLKTAGLLVYIHMATSTAEEHWTETLVASHFLAMHIDYNTSPED